MSSGCANPAIRPGNKGSNMKSDLILAIDVGTGSVRAALGGRDGGGISIRAVEHDQIVPAYGWSEQRPRDWWASVVQSVRAVLDTVDGAAGRISSIAAC